MGSTGQAVAAGVFQQPTWQAYIEEYWLPQLPHMAVVLNWSERRTRAERCPLRGELPNPAHAADGPDRPGTLPGQHSPVALLKEA